MNDHASLPTHAILPPQLTRGQMRIPPHTRASSRGIALQGGACGVASFPEEGMRRLAGWRALAMRGGRP